MERTAGARRFLHNAASAPESAAASRAVLSSHPRPDHTPEADRFGPLPMVASRLLDVAELRMDAALWSIRYIGLEDGYIAFTFTDARRIEQLARKHNGKLRIVDGQHAYWPLRAEDAKPIPKLIAKTDSRSMQPVPETNAQIVARTDMLAILRKVLGPL